MTEDPTSHQTVTMHHDVSTRAIFRDAARLAGFKPATFPSHVTSTTAPCSLVLYSVSVPQILHCTESNLLV